MPPSSTSDPDQDQTGVTKCKTSTPKTKCNQIGIIPGHNIERAYLTQTPLWKRYRETIHDMDNTTKTEMTCPKEDWFNESITTL